MSSGKVMDALPTMKEVLELIKNPEVHARKDKTVVKVLLETTLSRLWFKRQGSEVAPLDWKYLCMEHWVLEHGRFYEWSPLPEGTEYREIKMCFANSWLESEWDENRCYVEGYSQVYGLPIHHAWNVDADDPDRVIDVTMRPRESGESGPIEYFGAVFDFDYVNELKQRREVMGVIDNYTDGFPLLKNDELLSEVLWQSSVSS